MGCAPTSLGYLNLEGARLVDRMRLDGHFHESMLDDAVGIAVLDASMGSMVVSVTYGNGVVLRRLGKEWSPPVPVDLVVGTLGLQIGGKTAKMIMVFRTEDRFNSFVFDNQDFVAEASGTAGSHVSSTGHPLQKKDVELIMDAGGFYGGAAIGYISVSINNSLMDREYGDSASPHTILDGHATPPPGALSLGNALDG